MSTCTEPAADSPKGTQPIATRRAETPAEYTRRILDYLEDKDPFSVLEATPGRLRQILLNTSPEALRRRPAPGRWSPAEIMAHLADAEIVGSYRLRMVIAHNGVPIQAFDQDEWAANLTYDTADPAESVDLFEATRRANLRLLRRVDARLHENYGMHSERGRETVAHLIRLYAGHDLNHLGQIEVMVG